ncbi:MAG: ABC transporter permease [Methanomethylophilus sp.]|jgi:multidrug/hemolysin transport system permease protein
MNAAEKEGIIGLAKRDFLCFIRDRNSVFFSLLAVLIVIFLYLLFLRSNLVNAFDEYPGIDHLIDAWVLSGVVGIVPVTSAAGALMTMVTDRCEKRGQDILLTPMSELWIAVGHVIGTFITCTMMSYLALIISVAFLAGSGTALTASGIIGAAVLVLPSSLSAAAVMYAACTFIRTTGAYSGFCTAVGVLIGFLCGIYMPVGELPDGVAWFGALMPASQFGMVFRQLLAEPALDAAMEGAPASTVEDFRLEMGFDLKFGDFTFSAASGLALAGIVTVLFLAFAVYMHRRGGAKPMWKKKAAKTQQ